MAFTAMVDDHSEFDLATVPGLLVPSNFQRVFSIEVPCLSLESPSLHCKKGRFKLQAIPKFAVGVCNRKHAMQRRRLEKRS